MRCLVGPGKMGFQWRKTTRVLSIFLFSRYPFINAVTLLLLLGERAQREKYVYVNVYGLIKIFDGR